MCAQWVGCGWSSKSNRQICVTSRYVFIFQPLFPFPLELHIWGFVGVREPTFTPLHIMWKVFHSNILIKGVSITHTFYEQKRTCFPRNPLILQGTFIVAQKRQKLIYSLQKQHSNWLVHENNTLWYECHEWHVWHSTKLTTGNTNSFLNEAMINYLFLYPLWSNNYITCWHLAAWYTAPHDGFNLYFES